MNETARPEGSPWAIGRVAGLLALWLLATIAFRPLLLPDEGRYAGVAWEMLRGQGWISHWVPTLNGLPFFHKPPLLYLLDQAAMVMFGINHFAVRCGPALLAWIMGMAVFLHARRWHGEVVARIALVVMATSPFFFIGGQYVNHDIGVAACITAAVLCVVRAVDATDGVALRWLLAGWAFCGLGVLAKGLIGVVLPALIIGPWLLAQGRWRQMLGLLHPLGLLVFAAVVLPWMALMQSQHPGFFDYFIVEQHFKRYTSRSFNNRMPFWFYFAALPLLLLPWSLWLAGLRPSRLIAQVAPQARSRLGLYGWWLLAVLVFFSLPSSKLVGYALPAVAPAVLVLALVLQGRQTPWPRVALASAAVCVAIVATLAWKAPGSSRELALQLAAQRQPGERVVFVEAYYYDLPFYARLTEPVIALAHWDAPGVETRDNWMKEMHDARRFAADQGASVLWIWNRLPDTVCTPGRVWFVTAAEHRHILQKWLPGLELVAVHDNTELLKAPGRSDCPAPGGGPR